MKDYVMSRFADEVVIKNGRDFIEGPTVLTEACGESTDPDGFIAKGDNSIDSECKFY